MKTTTTKKCETRGAKVYHHKRQRGGENCQQLDVLVYVYCVWMCFLCTQWNNGHRQIASNNSHSQRTAICIMCACVRLCVFRYQPTRQI